MMSLCMDCGLVLRTVSRSVDEELIFARTSSYWLSAASLRIRDWIICWTFFLYVCQRTSKGLQPRSVHLSLPLCKLGGYLLKWFYLDGGEPPWSREVTGGFSLALVVSKRHIHIRCLFRPVRFSSFQGLPLRAWFKLRYEKTTVTFEMSYWRNPM